MNGHLKGFYFWCKLATTTTHSMLICSIYLVFEFSTSTAINLRWSFIASTCLWTSSIDCLRSFKLSSVELFCSCICCQNTWASLVRSCMSTCQSLNMWHRLSASSVTNSLISCVESVVTSGSFHFLFLQIGEIIAHDIAEQRSEQLNSNGSSTPVERNYAIVFSYPTRRPWLVVSFTRWPPALLPLAVKRVEMMKPTVDAAILTERKSS